MQTFCGLTTDGMLDYLADIYRLGVIHERVTTTLLAESMAVSAPAASGMLRRLEESGLVERSVADGVTLTDQGRRAALQLIRRHRLLEVFLIQVMGFTWDQVDVEAHRLEHAISDAVEERMDILCSHPTHCPHGDPIPTKEGFLHPDDTLGMLQAPRGQTALLRRVSSRDPSVLRYLARLGLVPGCQVVVQEVAPFMGPVTVQIGNGQAHETQMLGQELAQFLYVKLIGDL